MNLIINVNICLKWKKNLYQIVVFKSQQIIFQSKNFISSVGVGLSTEFYGLKHRQLWIGSAYKPKLN